ncbi:peptide ABC transporter substrate-binding protein [Erysipelothrix urinaevulpis]|uniref:peptide ABC transporter substrate-binding protein n=1 Tax=Erysipelothrix urinaevulpis TaxID=2683717 RepID=UPI00135CE46C|nr:peptide ABC transporter substrate-binding protein [Erysipelothrix urinaevulpis]
MRKLSKVFVLLLLSLALVACSGKGKDEGAKGKIVTFAKENDIVSMDSRYATDGMSFEIIAATTEGLMTVDKDGNVIPALAESHTISDDKLTWTFKLRDAQWANGEKVTAHDFVYAWQEANTNPDAIYNYLFTDDGASVVNAAEVQDGSKDKKELGAIALDETTLEVKLTKPVSFFDSLMSFPVFFPLNEKFMNETGDQFGLTPENTLANGPFKLVTWEKGSKVSLVKNDTYWDKDNVKVDGLDFNIIAEASTAVLDFESGSTNFVKLNSDLIDKYKDSEEFTSVLEGYLWYFMYNLDNEFLANANIRQALSLSIDRAQLADNVLKDGSIATEGFVPVGLATGPDGKDYRDSADAHIKTDKEEAKNLWTQGKKDLGVENIKIRLLFEGSDPAKPAAEFILSELTSNLEGLELEMVSVPKENRLEMQKQKDFDISLTRWGPDYADPTTYLSLLTENSPYNYGKYNSAAYNDVYGKVATTFDLDARWDLLKQAEKIAMDDMAVTPIFQVGGASLISKNVTGLETHAVGVPFIYKNVTFTE